MNILTLENISKSFTGKMLFDEASFFLHEGEKVGVIGINGTGKSTLLKIISGIEEVDEGKRILANNLVVRYLPQNPSFDKDASILETVVNAAGDIKENAAKSMLNKLGITDFNEKTGNLSGGQRKRLALVSALLAPSDILVLDEPTNHLDSYMSTWLETMLNSYKGAIVMVTHDRYFLDLVCNRIVEVDKGKLYSYDENYSGFLMRKAEREDIVRATERKNKSILKKEIEWMQRGARARTTKAKAHIKRYETLASAKIMEDDMTVEMSSASSRLGKTTVELENISKAYGDKILIKDFTYIFLKGDRVGFVGPNGSGKTTLMKIITNQLPFDSGKVTIGKTVKIGYYTQEIIDDPSAGIAYMDPKLKVIDYIRNTAEFVTTDEGKISASVMLDRFLFTSELKYSLIEKLSGGEKRRLNLLRVLMEAPNVLILDEPTNDLDIATLQVLEDYLDTFAGIVITVSHDRYFLDRVVRRIFSFDGNGKISMHEGGYTYYENSVDLAAISSVFSKASENKSEADGQVKKPDSNSTRTHSNKLKFTYAEQKEFASIDEDIAALEDKIKSLEADMLKFARDSFKLNEIANELEKTKEELEYKTDRWLYLTDLDERIKNQ